MIDYQKILNQLYLVRPVSDGRWRARCPAHKDREPSLQITVGRSGDRILLRCWGGCSLGEILQALGLQSRDLFENSARRSSPQRSYRISRADFENAQHLIAFYRADEKCGFLLGTPSAADLLKLREAADVVRAYHKERGL